MKITTIFGTRPEAIKLAPIIQLFQANPDFESKVIITGQHRQMLDQVLEIFKIKPNHDLNVMSENQSLGQMTSRMISGLDSLFSQEKPDYLLVQGDTSTVLSAALVAFYHQIKIGHVEAGLRTHVKNNPFPEEMNRRMAGILADLHFAPTELARDNLLKEGVDPATVFVTRNTVIDALFYITSQKRAAPRTLAQVDFSKRVVAVTMHRRESQGQPMVQIAEALKVLAERHSDIEIVVPLHLNPNVQNTVRPILQGISNIRIIDPLDYFDFTYLLQHCFMILTDSGGVQEEAPSLGKPVLVMRETTERPEGVDAGVSFLVGTNGARIIEMTEKFLTQREFYESVAHRVNPYGDGKAAQRILDILRSQMR